MLSGLEISPCYVHFYVVLILLVKLTTNILPTSCSSISFYIEKWVDHVVSKYREAKGELALLDKALANAEKKYKGSLCHLAEAERGRKNAEAALEGFEK